MDSSVVAPYLRIGAPLSGEPHPGLQWIEVASFLQIPGFQVIGLPAPEVAEARERVRAAIGASELEFPRRRVILNLSPASIRKRGTGADLAMALAVLYETYGPKRIRTGSLVAWGELGLDGTIKGAGQLSCALFAAWEAGADALLVASEEYASARERLAVLRSSGLITVCPPPRILCARNLKEAWGLLRKLPEWPEVYEDSGPDLLPEPSPVSSSQLLSLPRSLERLLGIAASGSHHLILLGPRGTGKSHALEWLIALQPELTAAVQFRRALLEELIGGGLVGPRSNVSAPGRLPIRRISPQVRPAALIGKAELWGVRPGEFSLAHGGLLLADELPEWPRDSREALREPLERGCVTLTRARQSVELPARFTLAANGNLCPCGGWPPDLPTPMETGTGKIAPCICSARARRHYMARLSGPILDRVDLMGVSARPGEITGQERTSERLEKMREQVTLARTRSIASWGKLPTLMTGPELESLLDRHSEWHEPLNPSHFTSLRARHKMLRVALSLAAWDGLPTPSRASFIEAACYRPERFYP